jgi:hypothetical protein
MRKLQADGDVHDSRECTSPTLNLLQLLTAAFGTDRQLAACSKMRQLGVLQT